MTNRTCKYCEAIDVSLSISSADVPHWICEGCDSTFVLEEYPEALNEEIVKLVEELKGLIGRDSSTCVGIYTETCDKISSLMGWS